MTRFDSLLAALPQPPEFRYDWDALRALAPLGALMERMARTPQNPLWHGEGDVLAHTRMVCDALCALAPFRALEADRRQALALAALMHDAGKTTCTRMEGGAWVSPRHGAAGAHMARRLLWQEFGACGRSDLQRLREATCLLIRHHTAPLHMIEGEQPERRALKLAANGELAPAFTLEALCLLAEADVRGRVAPDVPELLEAVELSRQLAREQGCWNGPYPFRSARTERALFSGGNVWKDQALFDSTWGEVILLCGLPGTGKDHWISQHFPQLPTVCLDDLRRALGIAPTDNQGPVVQAAKARAAALLRAKQPFVWNATCLTARRSQQIEMFEAYGARVRAVYLETEWAENLRRNAARPAAVPEGVIDGMLGRLEPPERFESQQVQWHCV